MLTSEEKIKFIQNQSEKLNITAYEFGKNAQLSEMSAYNILTGSNKNPRKKTLDTMVEYIYSKINTLEDKEIGRAIPGHPNYDPNLQAAKEPETPAYTNAMAQTIAKQVEQQLKPHLDKINALLSTLILDIDDIQESKNRKNKTTGG